MPLLEHSQETPLDKRPQQHQQQCEASSPPSSPTEDDDKAKQQQKQQQQQQQYCTKTPETTAATVSSTSLCSSSFQRRWNYSCSPDDISGSSSQHTPTSVGGMIVETSCSSYCGGGGGGGGGSYSEYNNLEISQRSSTSRTLFSESDDTELQEDSVSSSSSSFSQQSSSGVPIAVCELPISEVTPQQQQHETPPCFYYNFHPSRIISESSSTTAHCSLRSRRSSSEDSTMVLQQQQQQLRLHRSRMRRTTPAVLTTAAATAAVAAEGSNPKQQQQHHHHDYYQHSQTSMVVAIPAAAAAATTTTTTGGGNPLLNTSSDEEAEQPLSVVDHQHHHRSHSIRRKLRRRSRKSSRLLLLREQQPPELEEQPSKKQKQQQQQKKNTTTTILFVRHFVWIWLAVGLCSISLTFLCSQNMMFLSSSSEQPDEHTTLLLLQSPNNNRKKNVNVLFRQLEEGVGGEQPSEVVARPSAGLRGNMLHEVVVQMEQQVPATKEKKKQENEDEKETAAHRHKHKPERKNKKKKDKKKEHSHGEDKKEKHKDQKEKKEEKANDTAVRNEAVGPIEQPSSTSRGEVVLPAGKLEGTAQQLTFQVQDPRFYRADKKKIKRADFDPRVALMDSSGFDSLPRSRQIVELYPAEFTDNTQYYSVLDSNDERVSSTMERRPPLEDGECVPMQDWQKTFHPSCNGMHEVDMVNIGENNGDDLKLFGTKGYWRNAWRVDSLGGHSELDLRDTVVLKTLKINHRFEEKHFEHDRIDAVAMERLTASPHVINIFGYCGHSVMTEFADGKRLGELADKAAKTPLSRLRIARDIANGLADVHGIDGEGNATFVHLDVNPANVVSVNGTLKLNDFNIGILRRWNTTSNTPCGFPAAFPNPQWRSPEEARGEQHLTEKVDVFSLGHILFRLICEHEPWNKLEPGGRPSKEEMNEKVIKGVLPFIPEKVKSSTDPEIVAIREAMLQCYTYKPEKRPSAREIANALQNTLDQLENIKTSS